MRKDAQDKQLKSRSETKQLPSRLYRTRDGRLVPESDSDAYQLVLSGFEDSATRQRVIAEFES